MGYSVVGASVGEIVGKPVGFFVGTFVGFLVGAMVGILVGALVGDGVKQSPMYDVKSQRPDWQSESWKQNLPASQGWHPGPPQSMSLSQEAW